MKRNRFKQPSFGKISASRTQSTGTFLFGSEVKHNSFITLEITHAELERSETTDYIYSNEIITRVELSPVQWAELLTNMNTSGVPCTIRFSEVSGNLKYEPLQDRMNETYKEASKSLKEHAGIHLAGLLAEIEALNISQKKKDELKKSVKIAYSHLDSNAKFYLSEFEKAADKIVVEAKANAEAHKQSIVESLGWDAIEKAKHFQRLKIQQMNNLTTPQREHLYRGKRLDNGQWVEGDLIHNGFDGTSRTFPIGIAKPGCYPIEVDPSTIGQYINRNCDKTGEKIFEGMEVEFSEPSSIYPADRAKKIGIIVFADCSFVIEDRNGFRHYRWMDYHVEIYNQSKG